LSGSRRRRREEEGEEVLVWMRAAGVEM